MIFSLFQCSDTNSYNGPLNKGNQICCVKKKRPIKRDSGTSAFSLLLSNENAESLLMRSKAVYCVQSQLTNLSLIKEPRIDSPWKRQILKARWVSYLFLLSWVLRCVSCGKCFERFRFRAIWRALRNLDDHALRGESEHGLRESG